MISLTMTLRQIAGNSISPVGLGCMGFSHSYGLPPTQKEAIKVIHAAIDLGVDHFDTAALYGFGENESLLGRALKGKRAEVFLASKCGMAGVNGKRVIDGHPKMLQQTIDQALQRLDTDTIDLYYLHRWDRKVPIEDSIGALKQMVEAGKIRAIGLSEVSAPLIEQAHLIHPISAVQTEYSLWTRNAEIKVSDLCKKLNIALVAFSPLARGFFANSVKDPQSLMKNDIRRNMPRFQEPHFSKNLLLLSQLNVMATEVGATSGQLALAWLLHQGEHVLPIPSTTNIQHLEENVKSSQLPLSDEQLSGLDTLINQNTVSGARYPVAAQADIDTEEF